MKNRWRRDRRRRVRDQMQWLAYFMIAAPLAAPLLDRPLRELVAGIPVGLGMLWWFRRHQLPPEHLASVDYVVPDGTYRRPGAAATPFYVAWCDCGWMGAVNHETETAARREALTHTDHVRKGLHDGDE